MFSELIVGSFLAADGRGDGRTRMEDELMIFVRKQLSSALGQHRRVGVIGAVALVQRLGVAGSGGALDGESAIGGCSSGWGGWHGAMAAWST